MTEQELRRALDKALSSGPTKKILRFLLGCLGGTPWVGGVVGASATAWSESEQSKINSLFREAHRIHDDKIDEIEKKLVVTGTKAQWIAAYIKFNPNKAEFVDSSNVSSLIDNGYFDFTINFASPLSPGFAFQYFGSKEVRLNGVAETTSSVRVRFLEPCPDLVTFVFFNFESAQDIQPTVPADAPALRARR